VHTGEEFLHMFRAFRFMAVLIDKQPRDREVTGTYERCSTYRSRPYQLATKAVVKEFVEISSVVHVIRMNNLLYPDRPIYIESSHMTDPISFRDIERKFVDELDQLTLRCHYRIDTFTWFFGNKVTKGLDHWPVLQRYKNA
jgi:hypothetical protein